MERLHPVDSAAGGGCIKVIRSRVRMIWIGKVEGTTTSSVRLFLHNWLGILLVGRVLVVEVTRKEERVVDQL
jgi:hypothetical protein